MIYRFANKLFALWREVPRLIVTGPTSACKNATLTSEITPEYLGVGYIIGPRISGIMVSGSVLSWLALIPLLSMLVPDETIKADLLKLGFTQGWIDGNSQANWIYRAYIRYIGAGAVAMARADDAGPHAARRSTRRSATRVRELRSGVGGGSAATHRARHPDHVGGDRLGGDGAAHPVRPADAGRLPVVAAGQLLIVVFGFFFVAVSSRIVGLIGSSSNPISGMTIATLLGTCLIFVARRLGRRSAPGGGRQAAALSVGAIVCIAAANAGATSQDLKTGYIVGATPLYQQIGLRHRRARLGGGHRLHA